ncbi:hypothetical protein OG21DRAFT_1523803 [Imleria badia]|nr:hypothetical protein OG21DRAFT_1523803 [Imleria badia]
MELGSVAQPEGPGKPFHVTLKPQSDSEGSMGRFGTLVVECGSTRLKTIQGARQLSACIINHHGMRSRASDKGKLVVGKDYICFLLYSEDEGDDEATWMKLTTDNLLRISCLGKPETTGSDMVVPAAGIVTCKQLAGTLSIMMVAITFTLGSVLLRVFSRPQPFSNVALSPHASPSSSSYVSGSLSGREVTMMQSKDARP